MCCGFKMDFWIFDWFLGSSWISGFTIDCRIREWCMDSRRTILGPLGQRFQDFGPTSTGRTRARLPGHRWFFFARYEGPSVSADYWMHNWIRYAERNQIQILLQQWQNPQDKQADQPHSCFSFCRIISCTCRHHLTSWSSIKWNQHMTPNQVNRAHWPTKKI